MEYGFFHPEIGYWQTTGEPSEEIRADYPEGTVEVPLQPGPDYLWDGGAWVPNPKSREEQRAMAILRIEEVHADFLRNLTGNATIEERDTWKTKEEAARALIAGDASDGQTAMIGFEAAGAGVKPEVLAQTIIVKAEAFQTLIGKAAGLRAKAKAAIAQATDETVPLDQVEPALAAIFEQLATEAESAVAEWQAGAG